MFSIGAPITPSITYKGSEPAFKEPVPRKRTVGRELGSPEAWVITKPATLP